MNSFTIRPSQKDYSKFGLMWIFDTNRAKEIFTGTKDQCYEILNRINNNYKHVRLETTASGRHWVHGYENETALVYNYDFDTEKAALDAAAGFLTR